VSILHYRRGVAKIDVVITRFDNTFKWVKDEHKIIVSFY